MNSKELFEYHRKYAEKGNPYAQYFLGQFYYAGDGVSKNIREAVKWFRKAAEQGDVLAQFTLGMCYYYGDGVLMDKKEAKKWIAKSAKQDYKDAQFYIDNFGDPDILKKYNAYINNEVKERQRLEDEERDFWEGLDDYEREAWRHKLDMD